MARRLAQALLEVGLELAGRRCSAAASTWVWARWTAESARLQRPVAGRRRGGVDVLVDRRRRPCPGSGADVSPQETRSAATRPRAHGSRIRRVLAIGRRRLEGAARAHCPYCKRSASDSGRLAARIAACAPRRCRTGPAASGPPTRRCRAAARPRGGRRRAAGRPSPGSAATRRSEMSSSVPAPRISPVVAARPRRARRPARRANGRSGRPGGAGRPGTGRPGARRARTPTPGRAGWRGRGRRAWSTSAGSSSPRKSRLPSCIVRRVHSAARAAPRENSVSGRSPRTARSWLPTRHRSAVLAGELHAGVRVGAVADEVAQAPDRVVLGARGRPPCTASKACRLPWMSETMATRMKGSSVGSRGPEDIGASRSRSWPPSRWPRPPSCSCDPGRGVIEPAEVSATSYFSADGDRAAHAPFRRPNLALFAASVAVDVAVLALLVRRPPAALTASGRPLARAAAAGAGLTVALTAAALPTAAALRRRSLRRRPRHPVLGRLGGRPASRRWASAASCRPRRRALFVALVRRLAAGLVGARRAAGSLGLSARVPVRRPVAARPDLQHASRRCPPGRARDDVLDLAAPRRGRASARSSRSTPHAARRPPTPTSPASGAPSGSCSTTRCCATSRPTRSTSWSPTSSATCATATSRAGCCSLLARRARRDARVARADRGVAARPGAPASAALLPAVALAGGARRGRRRRSIANQLSRAIERRADGYALDADRRARAVHRLRAAHRAQEHRRPRPAALADASSWPPTRPPIERIGTGVALRATLGGTLVRASRPSRR